MKVIFLDIDGVLVTKSQVEEWENSDNPKPNPSKVAVESLNKITEATGAKIVISSTWRFFISQAESWLRINGVTGDVIGNTTLEKKGTRGHEIKDWLEKHTIVEKFIIIDDDKDVLDMADKLIHTSFKEGLTDELANKAIDLLK